VTKLRPEQQGQITKGLDALAEEFDDVANAEEVQRVGESAAEELAQQAQVTEFIPVLVQSTIREQLIEARRQEQNSSREH
jgi:hypothetical protein